MAGMNFSNQEVLAEIERRSSPAPESGCWIWEGASMGRYGAMRFRGRTWQTHRVAYEVAVGPIGDGLNVCHRCDIGFCVNPAHLFLGTQSDNMLDAYRKGRGFVPRLVGDSHPNTRLTDDCVRAIYEGYFSGERIVKIAERLGIPCYRVRNLIGHSSRIKTCGFQPAAQPKESKP